MSGILLAGLTDQEAAAIEILIGMHWRGRHVVTIPRNTSLSVPPQHDAAQACGSCVIDLFGFGMRRHSPDNQMRLLQFLRGRPAVLLIWGSGGGWLESPLNARGDARLAWINLHYTSAQMLEGLKRISVNDAPRAAQPGLAHRAPAPEPALVQEHPAPVPDMTAELPAWRRALALAEQIKAGKSGSGIKTSTPPRPAPVTGHDLAQAPVAPHAPTPAPGATGLCTDTLQTILAAIPQVRQLPLTGLIVRIAAAEGPQLLRTSDGATFAIDTRQGWLASGLSVEALVKLLQTPGMHESTALTPIAPRHVEDSLRRLSMERHAHERSALDIVLWELLSDALSDVALEARGDFSIRLRRFPNFTQLSRVGRLDIQLAAICARTSQSLTDLARAFPRNTQDVYRFALLSSLSGAALVQSTAGGHRASAARAAPQVPAQRGFFKSLLDKLF